MNRKVRRVLQAFEEINKNVTDACEKWKKNAGLSLITPEAKTNIINEIVPRRFREIIDLWNLTKDEQWQIKIGIKDRFHITI